MKKQFPPMENTAMLDWALFYASLGWPVIPLYYPLDVGHCSCSNPSCQSPGKHPIVRGGLNEASISPHIITKWWHRWPKANIAVITGNRSRLLVIDVDPRHGGNKSLGELEAHHGAFESLCVLTGGGGSHIYLQHPKDTIVRNRINVLPGIDIRASGGYVVAPPSIHASGQGYTWKSNQSLAETPVWFLTLLQEHCNNTLVTATRKAKIIEGYRNNFLTSIAGSLRKRGLDDTQIERELSLLNQRLCNPPLLKAEVAKISRSIAKYAPDPSWEPVKELPEKKHLAMTLKDELLPDSLRPWIQDITKRMQVPNEFIAVPAIISIASLIGRKVGVYPKQNDNWLVVPNLWGGIVARPGYFKSPAIAEALKPMEALVHKANCRYEKEQKKWEITKNINEATYEAVKAQLVKALRAGRCEDIEVLQGRLMELKQETEDKKPRARRYKTNDATVEKISLLLLDNPNGLLLVRDELYGWIASLNKAGREGDREFYLESWNGYGSYTVDRVGRGTIHVPALCLSILGGIQPGKLEKHIDASRMFEGDDGLLQRFQLLIYPELESSWTNYDVSPDIKAYQKVENILAAIEIFSSNEKLTGVHFSKEAQVAFNEWRGDLEDVLRSGSLKDPVFESHLAKYRSLMPSLALIFHIIDSNGEIDPTSEIPLKAANLAIKWCQCLASHAKKIYKVELAPELIHGKALAAKILNGTVKDKDSLRSIYRRHLGHLETPRKVNLAVNQLTELNWVKIQSMNSGTKRSQILRINPELTA